MLFLPSHRYHWKPISREEGNKLRALAIIAILAHNFLHWVADSPGENEFTFRVERWQAFFDGLWHTPQDFVRLFASYFGHYGVQIFFFLSGYGIVRKYGANTPSWWAFQKQRWRALYPAVITAAFGYLIYEGFRVGWLEAFQTQSLNLLRQILGISNFLPDNVYHPIGPWWFISVILQFYLIVPMLLKWIKKHGVRVCYLTAAVCLLAECFLSEFFIERLNVNINHTILGHLDVCLLGMGFARREKVNLPLYVILTAGGLFLTSQWFETLWILSGVLLLIFLLPVMRSTCKLLEKSQLLSMALSWIGGLSMWLFLTNGYLRRPLINIASEAQTWWVSLWTCFAFFLLTFLWSITLRFLLEKITEKK